MEFKRHVLIIASLDVDLPGIDFDIKNYTRFFKSVEGGAWDSNEITICQNFSSSEIQNTLDIIRKNNNDLVIVVFVGHGEDYMNETRIAINNYEALYQRDLANLSNKQITILDCCREESSIVKSISLESSESFVAINENRTLITRRFAKNLYIKKNIMVAEQQVILKSCSNGEYAKDTTKGGLYSKNFIEVAEKYSPSGENLKNILSVHNAASGLVTADNPNQHPTYECPRLPNKLIISINPYLKSHIRN